jgi:hypothetical protein
VQDILANESAGHVMRKRLDTLPVAKAVTSPLQSGDVQKSCRRFRVRACKHHGIAYPKEGDHAAKKAFGWDVASTAATPGHHTSDQPGDSAAAAAKLKVLVGSRVIAAERA